jgi:hypothetical protein
MIDENAYGIGIGYYTLEDDEYGLEPTEFMARYLDFRHALRECLDELVLGTGVRALDLGHLVYAELADGDQTTDPLDWLKAVRARLLTRGFDTLGVVTFGGRWLPEADEAPLPELIQTGNVELCSVAHPSEPLRRALYADAAARQDEDCPDGWGPGLYVDAEALEPLGRKLKNAPTPLYSGGATYYRFGR